MRIAHRWIWSAIEAVALGRAVGVPETIGTPVHSDTAIELRGTMAGARAWQRMLSGRRLNLLEPSPLDIEIDDIAHGLARVARWNGQTSGAYAFSVAQHCVLVEQLAVAEAGDALSRQWRLAALLHDAPEYVIGDMISPFKAAIGGEYRGIERALLDAIHIRFGLPARIPKDIELLLKRADKVAAFTEAVDLAGFTEAEARRVLGFRRKVRGPKVVPLPPEDAKREFLDRFQTLFTGCA